MKLLARMLTRLVCCLALAINGWHNYWVASSSVLFSLTCVWLCHLQRDSSNKAAVVLKLQLCTDEKQYRAVQVHRCWKFSRDLLLHRILLRPAVHQSGPYRLVLLRVTLFSSPLLCPLFHQWSLNKIKQRGGRGEHFGNGGTCLKNGLATGANVHKANVTDEGVFSEPLSVFIITRVHVHALSLKCTACLLWILSDGLQFA